MDHNNWGKLRNIYRFFFCKSWKELGKLKVCGKKELWKFVLRPIVKKMKEKIGKLNGVEGEGRRCIFL